ncbi:MAG: hypothetical protein CMO55_05260 [Verrucomicrobiales bacterium]|nr:hypothetical protein [Verrucomicrobiales bacterium]
MGFLRKRIFQIAENRGKEIADKTANLFDWTAGGTVLDFGAGIGWLGYEIAVRQDLELFAVDIKCYPFTHPNVKPRIYDEGHLPYDDGEFDHAIVAFSLHHTKNAEGALREVQRVTRGEIVVLEDRLKSKKEVPFEVVKDVLANCFLDRITFEYKTEQEWENIFESLGLRIKNKITFSTGSLLPMRHYGWLLQ